MALEELGIEICRYTIRQPDTEVIDAEDIIERKKTRTILSVGLLGLLLALVRTLISAPLYFIKAFRVSTHLGAMNKRGILIHWAYLAEACVLRRYLARKGVKHVHAHFGTNSTTVALLCKVLGGPQFSFTVHGPEEFDDPGGLALGEKINKSDFVVAITSFCCSQLMRHCSVDQWHKIKKVHCTVDHSFLKNKPTPVPDNKRLVCVGRLCEQKGQLLLLDAFSILAEDKFDFELIFAGDGELRGVIENRIKELGLEKQTKITGWIDGNQVRQEIIKSRALVLPSFAEGLPVVIMEALALGRPVVSTYVAGIPELVKDGRNGFLVPAGSTTALADVLKTVLSADLSVLEQMGKHGSQCVAQDHNARIEAKKLASLFKASISR